MVGGGGTANRPGPSRKSPSEALRRAPPLRPAAHDAGESGFASGRHPVSRQIPSLAGPEPTCPAAVPTHPRCRLLRAGCRCLLQRRGRARSTAIGARGRVPARQQPLFGYGSLPGGRGSFLKLSLLCFLVFFLAFFCCFLFVFCFQTYSLLAKPLHATSSFTSTIPGRRQTPAAPQQPAPPIPYKNRTGSRHNPRAWPTWPRLFLFFTKATQVWK